MRSTPATLIAHDLKNALGALEGELEALAAEPTKDGARAAYQRCVDLKREFIQFLMVYGTGSELRAYCEDESPQDVLDSVCRAGQSKYAPHAHSPKMSVERSEGEPPYWYFDQRLVQMALDAALHNASRFARSQITLGLRLDNDYLVFVIDDDGPGPQGGDAGPNSTGLGTELCRTVARAHKSGTRQGRIELRHRPQGGTRFELWIP